MLSADRHPLEFTVPGKRFGENWAVMLDTAADCATERAGPREFRPGDRITLAGNSMLLLRRTTAS
jgi:hypothetical protein